FVLDTEATTEAEAVKVVTVGAPEIQNLSPNQVQLEGGEEVTITGKNFAPESRIIIGDAEVTDFDVESATQIRVRVPKQNIPGNRNLTIQTRGGVDQERILTVSKRFEELADGEITTVAGGIPYVGDGDLATGPTVGLRGNDLTLDVAGNIYVSDYFNARVRRIDANTGVITTVAGNGRFTFVGDGGLAVSAGVGPTSATFDGEGNLYVVDLINNRLRKIDPRTGIIQTIAGNGGFGFSPDGIPATQASLGIVYGATAVIDPQGNVVFSDPSSNRVRRINSQTGIISTLTGNGTPGFSGDGGPATGAVLFAPHGIVFDQDGNLFINDAGNQRIRRIDARTGVITTIAGNGARGFSGDGGPATSASFNLERGGGMAFDPAGNLYIADGLNFRVRRIDRQSN
ncbi:MAG TPA: IPT/TIG domain-containing protein, partial [Acidobacteriota bacterium]|nr:IPT/TIG domain-containing protein [Acidobacteriota bacterium]